MDELFELLTLVQTGKIGRKLPVLLYGREYWQQLLRFDVMVEWGTISANDLRLFQMADTPDEAFSYLKEQLTTLYLETADHA